VDISFKDDITVILHLGVSLMQWLPWLLRMERPGKPKLTLKSMIINNKIQTLEKADRYWQRKNYYPLHCKKGYRQRKNKYPLHCKKDYRQRKNKCPLHCKKGYRQRKMKYPLHCKKG
jgi:hypothetical protein